MKNLSEALVHFIPPMWLVLVLAALMGAALLAGFVDVLHENLRHGEKLREWQRAGVVRQEVGAVAAATPRSPSPQLAMSMSPTLQR